MKIFFKNFFIKCDQIHNFLRIWSHLLKKSLMENFIFCAAKFIHLTMNNSDKLVEISISHSPLVNKNSRLLSRVNKDPYEGIGKPTPFVGRNSDVPGWEISRSKIRYCTLILTHISQLFHFYTP